MSNQTTLDVTTPIKIDFKEELKSSLKYLLKATTLPATPPIPGTSPWSLGIDLSWLKQLKEIFESDRWDVNSLLQDLNRWPHYTVRMSASESEDGEVVDIHFLHIKSNRKDAIPLLMLHGWPGTFWDFHKVLEPLTNPSEGEPAFHLVVPSLPGYFLSSQPQHYDWTLVDTAKLIHRLMVDVLGYSRYAGQGGDWGSYILRVIGSLYPEQAPVLHFNMFRTPPIANFDMETLTVSEKNALRRREEFQESGRGYIDIQSTKPFTIGIAIASSPTSLLTYIGEKMYSWSDTRHLDSKDVLDTIALYYLSQSFATSVLIYHQSHNLRAEMTTPAANGEVRWKVRSKIGFSLFPYEIGASPRAYIQACGNLVFYKERAFGGHFPALDNPEGLIEDLREFVGKNWEILI
ncbi:hypothetical protein M422DRAFT_207769 [Sphaerobolus stellatus SS14]|uniref:Unplaced genomic scaffold SPHSTscaffold_40, whole genome shotgun sequence n=1 Tax=Sphaerobolus stellatus (strain SS14) TaxID=990650 RepID=A0A0C9W1H7_SPHS4|nr:hypothetical protein M422DRAFT_207769 [Sphaerobolus stellatus SS14]